MRKLTLASVLALQAISSANAQPRLGEAANNPMVTRALMPMIYCEEVVIRDNLFLPKYDKRIWPLIMDGCGPEIRELQEVCVLVTDYQDDDCDIIANDLLRHHYRDIVNDMIREERGM